MMAKVLRDSTSLPRSRSTAAFGTVLIASGMSSTLDMASATSAASSGEASTTATSSSASTARSRND